LGIRELPRPQGTDEHFASEIGRLYVNGQISLAEYQAGTKYANIVLTYLKTTDAPSPYGGGDLEDLDSIPDEHCLRKKLNLSAAREVLNGLDRRCGLAVDRVAVYDEPVRDGDLPPLRAALKALAGGV
jgi:hypothetical protein